MKSILILTAILTMGTSALAQEYGATIGVHQTTADTDSPGYSVEGQLNFKAGGLVGFELADKIKFRSGLLYSQRHIELKNSPVVLKANFDYLDIPANVQYNVNEMFGLFGGLTIAVNIGDDVKNNQGTPKSDPDAKKLVPLLDLGVNFTFSDMVGFDFYYQRGMGGFADQVENFSTFGGNFILWF